jgi:pimeloyl-ACP methyl ester carboxylesterase
MATITVNGATLAYEERGTGSDTVLMTHGFLFDHHAFDGLVAELEDDYKCVAFDWRGQGASEVTDDGYSVDTLTDDAIALIEQLGLAPCHYIGTSMGGWMGLRIALRRPGLLRSLILLNAYSGGESWGKVPGYLIMGVIARFRGMAPLVDTVMKALFTEEFLASEERATEREHWRQHIQGVDRHGAARTLGGVVLRPGDVTDRLADVELPTLAIAGTEDKSFSPDRVQAMALRIPDAEYAEIPSAGHAVAIEQPEATARLIRAFLERISVARAASA